MHGYCASSITFIKLFEILGKVGGLDIYAIDILGMGLSGRPKFEAYEKNFKKCLSFYINSLEIWRRK